MSSAFLKKPCKNRAYNYKLTVYNKQNMSQNDKRYSFKRDGLYVYTAGKKETLLLYEILKNYS